VGQVANRAVGSSFHSAAAAHMQCRMCSAKGVWCVVCGAVPKVCGVCPK